MLFAVLGPVRVRDRAGREVSVGGGKLLTTLAALLMSANEWVGADRLVDCLWESPPRSAAGNLSTYLWGLDRVLPAHASGGPRIERGPRRYRLLVDPDELDLDAFRRLTVAGRQARSAGRTTDALERLRAALDLWRGEPLSGVDSAEMQRFAVSLREERWAVEDDVTDLRLDRGEHADLVGPLRGMLAAQPTSERRWAQLMLALYRSGRQAEALEAYQQAYTLLDAELGVQPGEPLQRLQQQILRRDPTIAHEPQPRPVPGIPAQLPRAVRGFTGRAPMLRELDALLSAAATEAVVVLLVGSAGVGKTALAVHWAHRISGRFPDGQLYVNLDGYAVGAPLPTDRALELLGRGLGITDIDIPADLAARAALYRSVLAGRRVLVVLDNAADPDEVRALLPATPGCLTLITSRDALTGLVALDGAHRITLDVLTTGEAIDLLRLLLGADRVAAETAAVDRFVALCARLPLALRIAAARLDDQPLSEHVAAMAADRLGQLAVEGDQQAVVRSHFDHSYDALDATEQRLFRRFGLVPGADLTEPAAAVLAGTSPSRAAELLHRLSAAHLLDEPTAGRYTSHDLLRAYAAETAEREDGAEESDAALVRLLDWYLHTANLAMDHIDPHRRQLPEPLPAPAVPGPDVGSYERAMAWLEAERPNLLAGVALAARRGWHAHAWQLPRTLWRYFLIRGYLNDWVTTHQHALAAARRLDDPWAEAEILHNLATAYRRRGQHPLAFEPYRQALELRRRIDDTYGQAATLAAIAISHDKLGQYPSAIACNEQALTLYQQLGNHHGEALTRNSLGIANQMIGRYAEALDHLQQALRGFRQTSDPTGEAMVSDNLGEALQHAGRHADSLDHHRQAATLFHETGERWREAVALNNLATAHRALDRIDEALAYHREAFELIDQMGNQDLEAKFHHDTGLTHAAAGDHATALDHHERALRIARDTGNQQHQARAHHGIARAHQALGDREAARPHWQQALDTFTQLGVPDADDLRTELTSLDPVCQRKEADLAVDPQDPR